MYTGGLAEKEELLNDFPGQRIMVTRQFERSLAGWLYNAPEGLENTGM